MMTRRQAVLMMVLATLLWSMAGVVTRQVEQAQGLTLTFWRSAFNALALGVLLCVWRSPRVLWTGLRSGGWALWASGLCWATMYTSFMWALSMTTVANVLVTMALGPLITALVARWALGQRLTWPSVMAMVLAGMGLLLMQAPALWAQWTSSTVPPALQTPEGRSDPYQHAAGLLLALAVPLAGAINWVLIRAAADRAKAAQAPSPDFLFSVLIGAVMSALVSGMASQPLQASLADLGWLALLGVFQLAIPCLLAVLAARVLPPSEISLLCLLEVVFGVAWVWLGTSEQPQAATVAGVVIVLLTLLAHEAWNLRRHRQLGPWP